MPSTTRAKCALFTALLFVSAPAAADDIGSVRKKTPEFTATSNKGLFNLERCMIDTDNIGKPWVYRQPDMPERVMLVWESSDFGNATIIEMNGLTVTTIKHWGRNKVWGKVQPCLE